MFALVIGKLCQLVNDSSTALGCTRIPGSRFMQPCGNLCRIHNACSNFALAYVPELGRQCEGCNSAAVPRETSLTAIGMPSLQLHTELYGFFTSNETSLPVYDPEEQQVARHPMLTAHRLIDSAHLAAACRCRIAIGRMQQDSGTCEMVPECSLIMALEQAAAVKDPDAADAAFGRLCSMISQELPEGKVCENVMPEHDPA